MLLNPNRIYKIIALAAVFALVLEAGLPFKKKKYEDPIVNKSDQPDKILFDRAINDIEHGRFEVARITLNTLINTYDTSEYLAKAKLAIADSWYREGGAHAWAEAEAEYKDFKLFYPTMEEAAESQEKVCLIHYKQMDKGDRDKTQAQRAEDECRQLLVEYPNSKFAPQAQQILRNTQEVLASGEYEVGKGYFAKGSYPAAASRLQYLTDQYPLYSKTDEALWLLADSYHRMGDRFEDRAAAAYTRIVKDYPLSEHADEAADKLKAMNRPVPQADPAQYAWAKYELENRKKIGLRSKVLDAFKHSPDTREAAKSGAPIMASIRPPVPVSVPAAPPITSGTAGGVSDVTVQTVSDTTALDTKPDARANPGAAAGNAATAGGQAASAGDGSAARSAEPAGTQPASTQPASTASVQPLPMNHQNLIKKSKKQKKAEEEARKKQQAAPQQTQPANAQPAAQVQPAAQPQPQGTPPQPNQ